MYDLELQTIKDERNNKFLLCTSTAAASPIEYTHSQRIEMRLLLLVLAYIFMKGGSVLEHTLFGFLRKINVDNESGASFLGSYKKHITETFVKQLYLKKSQVQMETGNMEDK